MNIVIETHCNDKQILGSDNTMFIKGLKTIKGIANRILQSNKAKLLKENQILKVFSYTNLYDINTYKTIMIINNKGIVKIYWQLEINIVYLVILKIKTM